MTGLQKKVDDIWEEVEAGISDLSDRDFDLYPERYRQRVFDEVMPGVYLNGEHISDKALDAFRKLAYVVEDPRAKLFCERGYFILSTAFRL